MPLPQDPRVRGTSPPPTPIAATAESPPPGAAAASRLLWVLGAPTLAALVLLLLHWEVETLLGDPVLLLAVLLCAGTAVLLAWNLTSMAAAHLATASLLPSGTAHLLARLVQRMGTREARQVLARHGAAAALGTGIMLSVGPVAVAVAVPVPASVGAAATGVASLKEPSATSSTASPPASPPAAAAAAAEPAGAGVSPGADPTPLPPDDLSWGAPREPGTRADTPSPSPVSTSESLNPTPDSAADAASPGTSGSSSDTPPASPAVGPAAQERGESGSGNTLTRSPERNRGGADGTDPIFARLQTGPGRTDHATPDSGTWVGDTGTTPTQPPGTGTLHVVIPGESLWTIAAQHLGPDAGNEQISRLWPRIHAANAEIIGADPGVIHPGIHLVIPGTQP